MGVSVKVELVVDRERNEAIQYRHSVFEEGIEKRGRMKGKRDLSRVERGKKTKGGDQNRMKGKRRGEKEGELIKCDRE